MDLQLYQVTSNRKLGFHEYEIETLIEAASHLKAAQRFFLDWLDSGFGTPGVVAVNRACGGPILTFVVRDNMIQRED